VEDNTTMFSREKLLAKLEAMCGKSKEKETIDVDSSFIPQSSPDELSDCLHVKESFPIKAKSFGIEESLVNEEDLSENIQGESSDGWDTFLF